MEWKKEGLWDGMCEKPYATRWCLDAKRGGRYNEATKSAPGVRRATRSHDRSLLLLPLLVAAAMSIAMVAEAKN